ncbi:hypothetical protein Q9S78_12095 [Microbacterium sp. KSW-18]|uniref:Uncharacterized protein n=1 Tax=Microbacterium aquilitoris TaxID=3067307 RepID=A0ABU3GM15_9MICO|nr:hypothetical protein [Microbacterium sp. KSW-18]MDT3331410.1 hypothetical protein [Microbacterium sp. KSW-18]
MSKDTERSFGILPAPSWHRPFLRYITDPGDGVQDPGDQPEPGADDPEEPQGTEETTDWKAQARKWERQAKENKTAADELAALKQSQMTEDEKRAERLASLESENAALKAEKQIAAWKSEIASDAGIPAAALRGSTRDELEAHAKELQTLIPKKPAPTSPAFARVNQGDGVQESTSPGLGTLRAAYADSDK